MDLSRDRLETRELAYFVAVAEELHFSRAAERLGVAQPSLSRAIARLESRVGVRLLVRTSRSVALTASGRTLLAEARATLKALDRAVRRTKSAGADKLRLAATPGTGTVLLRALIAEHRRTENPAAVEMVFTRDAAHAVRAGTADVALVCSTEDLSGMQTMDIAVERPVALLPADHSLASEPDLSLTRLRRQANFVEHCPVLTLDEIVDSVALGWIIVIVGEGAATRAGPDLAGVPVTELGPSTLVLAWGDDVHSSTEEFLAAASRYRASSGMRVAPSVATV
jgi:DNA-binding transcriptional LysR family regulator